MLTKSQNILYIYAQLCEERKIKAKDIISELSISERSFTRYINEIRAFFLNCYINKELKYNRQTGYYYILNI